MKKYEKISKKQFTNHAIYGIIIPKIQIIFRYPFTNIIIS